MQLKYNRSLSGLPDSNTNRYQ